MLSKLRHQLFKKFFWGLMGIYLLNISVDTPDPSPESVPEDLTYNDQESVIEIFIEKVLGFEDAIAEYDDNDSKDHRKKQTIKIELVMSWTEKFNSFNPLLKEKKQRFYNYENSLIHRYIEIDSPPPKA